MSGKPVNIGSHLSFINFKPACKSLYIHLNDDCYKCSFYLGIIIGGIIGIGIVGIGIVGIIGICVISGILDYSTWF